MRTGLRNVFVQRAGPRRDVGRGRCLDRGWIGVDLEILTIWILDVFGAAGKLAGEGDRLSHRTVCMRPDGDGVVHLSFYVHCVQDAIKGAYDRLHLCNLLVTERGDFSDVDLHGL